MRFICVLSIQLLWSALPAQDISETLFAGRQQYTLENYKAARFSFERVLYFGQNENQVQALDYLGRISFAENNPVQAASFYGRAASVTDDPGFRYWCILRKSAGLINTGQHRLALSDLYGLDDTQTDSLVRYRQFLTGVALFSDKNFSASHDAFRKALSSEEHLLLDSLFACLWEIKHPNPRTAKLLSIVFPGAGQFYAGDIKNGINSLLLTGGFVALGINAMLQYGLLDAAVAIIPWLQRYYMGGYQRAERIAADRLRYKQDRIYQQILDIFDRLETKDR